MGQLGPPRTLPPALRVHPERERVSAGCFLSVRSPRPGPALSDAEAGPGTEGSSSRFERGGQSFFVDPPHEGESSSLPEEVEDFICVLKKLSNETSHIEPYDDDHRRKNIPRKEFCRLKKTPGRDGHEHVRFHFYFSALLCSVSSPLPRTQWDPGPCAT